MNELLFLGTNDKIPTWCSVIKDHNIYVITYKDEQSGNPITQRLHSAEYSNIKRLTLEKFMDSKFMEDVAKDREMKTLLSDINDRVFKTNKLDYMQHANSEDLKTTNKNSYYNSNVDRVGDHQKYIDDMKNIMNDVYNAEVAGNSIYNNSKFVIENVINFMNQLTHEDREQFYSDIRTEIDSKFYDKVVVTKEEYERFKSQEQIITKLKEII